MSLSDLALQKANSIAVRIRQRTEKEIAFRTAKRDLATRELQLVSQYPPEGKNEAERKLDKERRMKNDKFYIELDNKVFNLEIDVLRLDGEISALEKEYSGIRWQIREQILKHAPMESMVGKGSDYQFDTEVPFEDSLEKRFDQQFSPIPPTNGLAKKAYANQPIFDPNWIPEER